MASQLYQKQLPVLIRCPGRDDRRTHVCLTMEMERYPGLERGRTLIIRLTDDNDLFFLHTLRMAYDDFHLLKEQEKFLIDFDAFPRQIMDFLDLCIQEELRHPPKYIVHVHVATQQAESRLDVVETNEFQHVTRLKLRMTPADDVELKKYLAECLKMLRQEKQRTEAQADAADKEARFRINSAEEGLRRKTEEFDQLQAEWNLRASGIHEKYAEDLAREREKAESSLRDVQTRYDEERRNLESSTKRTITKLEAKNYELETINKDIVEKKSRLEGGIQELKDRLGTLEEELKKRSIELQTCRKQLNDSQSKLREGDNFRASMDEQIQKYQDSIVSFQERMSVTQGQVERLERTVEQKELQISRLQKDAQLQASELNKANDIIRKMQLENRTTSEKLKIRSSIVVQQEKLLEDTKSQLEAAKSDIVALKASAAQKETELSELEDTLEKEKSNLAEAEKSLENNANVISWLNRQLNVVNGRSIQTLHPSTTVSSLSSRFVDLNIPFSDPSGAPSYPSGGGVGPHNGGTSRSPLSSDQRSNHTAHDERPRKPVVDEKYLQSPVQTRPPANGKIANLTPTSALKTVSSAYFS
ncbi:Spindle assembly abnormal protein 6-like protein [Hypsibius exemplaris]|uniref:Spindle assembly abnormal protein 6 homolog n=1 Tax=Hypsibius exemplaris TaxID=2072580 RepID=A0A1W0X4T0_HYPEX|nr:Spindle assembly abnormal protein 6-like protein [Hypsibius exemplaris]